MKILAVDTALGACSAAILDDNKVLAHRFVAMERGHAEAIAPMVDAAMRESGVTFAALDRLAVTTGPGTFTGQRVGLAFMRGLRVALKRPLIGITTLHAMCAAAMAEAATPFAAAIHDARRGEAYLSVASALQTVLPASLVPLDNAGAQISSLVHGEAPVALAGSAAEFVADRMHIATYVTSILQPDALWVARLAVLAAETSEAPHPLYLRAPDARLPAAKP
jgi:tRNA threonylcarbamoyladenosine biosynthesis protein TsaB